MTRLLPAAGLAAIGIARQRSRGAASCALAAMNGHVLAKGGLVGLFGKPRGR
jgi:hypothetical protein